MKKKATSKKMQKGGGTPLEKAQAAVDRARLNVIRKYAKAKYDSGLIPDTDPWRAKQKKQSKGGSIKTKGKK